MVLAKKIEIYSAALRIEAHFVGLRFVVFKVFLDPRVFMKDGSVCRCSHSAATTNRAAILYTCDHQMTLNADKCKVMNIDFKKNWHAFEPVIVDGKEISVVSSAKILGVTLSSDLTWSDHVNEAIRKANKRLYFLVLLKRAGVNPRDIINFYCTVVRPVLEYCSPIFHHALPKYLIMDIERVQKRALSIILPDCSYSLYVSTNDLDTLRSRREEQCFKSFNVISDRAVFK